MCCVTYVFFKRRPSITHQKATASLGFLIFFWNIMASVTKISTATYLFMIFTVVNERKSIHLVFNNYTFKYLRLFYLSFWASSGKKNFVPTSIQIGIKFRYYEAKAQNELQRIISVRKCSAYTETVISVNCANGEIWKLSISGLIWILQCNR